MRTTGLEPIRPVGLHRQHSEIPQLAPIGGTFEEAVVALLSVWQHGFIDEQHLSWWIMDAAGRFGIMVDGGDNR